MDLTRDNSPTLPARTGPRPLHAYACAAAAVLTALGLRLLLEPVLQGNAPLLLFTPAVVVAAWYGGFWPGLFAAGLSLVLGERLILGSRSAAEAPPLADAVRVVMFVLTGVVISVLSESLDRARRRAERSGAEARDALRARAGSEDDLRYVLTHARCILWRGEIDGVDGWDAPGAGPDKFRWRIQIQDERAAQQVLPLNVAPGQTYLDVWFASRNPGDQPAMDRTSNTALRGGQPGYTQVLHCTDRDRRVRALQEDVALRPLTAGRWEAFAVVTDITGRVDAERERADLLAREQRARADAEAANRRRDQFLAVLSHELRTPLTPVLARVGLMQRDAALSATHGRALDMIRRNVEMEARLIDDLLDLNSLARGELKLAIAPAVDAHDRLRAAVEIYQEQAAGKALDLSVDLAARAHHVRADPARLQQVFWNLVGNAVKFTPPGGRIDVRTLDAPNDRLRIVVRDTGVGVEPDAMPRLFNAFEQGEQTLTRRFGGLGLGLTIVKRLVDLHGGTIAAQSDGVGHGATFTVELPTVPAPVVVAAAPPVAPVLAPSAPGERVVAAADGRRRVLLVEDNPDTLHVMARVLRSLGCEVVTAAGVTEAMDAARARDFDLLVSDVGLPDGTGWELIQAMRTIRPNVRGVAISGFVQPDDIRRSLAAGFEEHLAKPVDIERLESAVRGRREPVPA